MVKAAETNLAALLAGEKVYRVPLYQRTYSWGTTQLGQLWDDLIEIAELRADGATDRTHFIGSLVLAPSWSDPTGLNELIVVDGQQRLTTLTLLLAAIRDAAPPEASAETARRINGLYLLNEYREGRPTKLLPTQDDRAPYEACLYGSLGGAGQQAMGFAYRFLLAKVTELVGTEPDAGPSAAFARRAALEAADGDPRLEEGSVASARLTLRDLEDAVVTGLTLVEVTAQGDDNVHRIFESLNNTGLRLTQADLLRNYIFMRLGDRSDAVYREVWLPLQQLLGADGLELLFWLDLVLVDERATQKEVYLGQKRRLEGLATAADIEADLRRIATLGIHLTTMLEPEREPNPGVRTRLEHLRDWRVPAAFPLVLQLLDRRERGQATTEQVAGALLAFESYLVRRLVTGDTSGSLGRTLIGAVSALDLDPRADVALRAYLSGMRRGWAPDAAVRALVEVAPFYRQGRAEQRNLVLQWLEQALEGKERVSLAGLTIEHVLPQTLTPAWERELAEGLEDGEDVREVYESLVHTLGNLTLTGYNSELSNDPFAVKREVLGASPLVMNRQIAGHGRWGRDEIVARGRELADLIVREWPGPAGHGDDDREVRRLVAAVAGAAPVAARNSFLERAAATWGGDVAAGFDSLMSAWESMGGWLWFGRAASSCRPTLGEGGSRGEIWPFVFYASHDRVEVSTAALRRRAPFTDEALVVELLRRLDPLPGARLEVVGTARPLIDPEALASPAGFEVVRETFAWFVEVCRGAGW